MATQEQYERWQRGEAPITECVQDTTRLLAAEVEANPGLSYGERYAFALGSLTASVAAEIKADLFALIRSGEIR